ncbi:uncharacterized protein MELLADRAFT_90622 [Melampsora larici-populina 98AG31]|uniref:Uncharacterized protein n=1 Tax=Melampsora larici-populina (strain 98AG31 / pathotype 3-4-7) TaxID=747676 RepID=F4RXJ6_MELLP|nr:uncharacterized protein MELLADRAFT_90622 [Melampsora larici-populina 98AG31]EGG02881.1 hypothetical protein MELLADRAFT_90622 [Melampsora larici-populina 98AG31]
MHYVSRTRAIQLLSFVRAFQDINPFLQNKFEYTHFNHTHDTLMSNLTESALVNLHKCKNQGVSQVNYCKSIAISKKSTVYLVLYTVRCRVQPPYATGL